MTAIENLRALKLQLEQQLNASPTAEEREWHENSLVRQGAASTYDMLIWP
jgi:hypothetical protein